MSYQNPEILSSVDHIDELTRVHPTIEIRDVTKFLKEIHANAEPYSKKMLDDAIRSALQNADSSQVGEAFRGFAITIEKERKVTLNKALKTLIEKLDFGEQHEKK